MISNRFESLSQAFRVFAEQQFRFNHLFLVDAPEAVGNLDHAVDGILNAFHGLYDASQNEAGVAFSFYDDPICALVLRLRNARHHNQANGVRSIYRRARSEERPIDYLLVDFPAGANEENGSFASYYVAWGDLQIVLAQQQQKYPESVAASYQAVAAHVFERWCGEQGYSTNQIFINIIPVLSAAGSACIGALSPFIRTESVEAAAFLDLFQSVETARFAEPDYVELTSAVFWPK